MSNAMDRSANDMLWSDSKGNGAVRSERNKHEGVHCEDGDSDSDC